jgi:hypothetical protein
MKTLPVIYILIILLTGTSCSVSRTVPYESGQQSRYNDAYYADYSAFYDNLSPYGHWVEYPAYGYVWIPDAGRNFFPYVTDGRWVLTEFGWTWVSDYEWGWAPFHYGRWDYDNYYGWFWVPDNQWGPAWVIWRRADGYFGWAPMRPGTSPGTGLTGSNTRDIERWSFVREKDFGRSDLQSRYVNRRNNEEIFRNSTVINNSYIDSRRDAVYISGPRPEDVRRITGRKTAVVEINDTGNPGTRITRSGMSIYRPVIKNDSSNRIAPPELSDPREVPSAQERRPSTMRRGNEQGSRAQGSRRPADEDKSGKDKSSEDHRTRDNSRRR